MDNCKPYGGAILLYMVEEFDLPFDIIDRKVTRMKMISPSTIVVGMGQTLKPHEYVGILRRQELDAYLCNHAATAEATVVNGLFLKMDLPQSKNASYAFCYTDYNCKTDAASEKKIVEVDAVIGINSRIAKGIDAGDYDSTSMPSPSKSASKSCNNPESCCFWCVGELGDQRKKGEKDREKWLKQLKLSRITVEVVHKNCRDFH